MNMEDYFDINYTKRELQKYLDNGSEPELCLKINNNDYMIIPLKNQLSFQEIGVTEEAYYKDINELFTTELINGLILDRDWDKVQEIWYY